MQFEILKWQIVDHFNKKEITHIAQILIIEGSYTYTFKLQFF